MHVHIDQSLSLSPDNTYKVTSIWQKITGNIGIKKNSNVFIPCYRLNIMDEMRQKLPDYICNCLEVTGFDNVEAICEIDRNTLTAIESHIEKHKIKLPSCIRKNDDVMSSTPFQFPLGHAILILKFASSIKMTNNKRQLENTPTEKPLSKKRKVMDTANTPSSPDTVPAVTNEIRNKILKWTRGYKKGEASSVAGMTEGVDFFIDVKVSEINSDKCDASIHCRCGKSYLVLIGPKGERLINSWVKHVKTCSREKPNISQDMVTFFTQSQQQISSTKTNQSPTTVQPVPPTITTAADMPPYHGPVCTNTLQDELSDLPQLPTECGTKLIPRLIQSSSSLAANFSPVTSPSSQVTSPLPPPIEEINDHTNNPADAITSSSPQVFQ